jgi:hypothetical protein
MKVTFTEKDISINNKYKDIVVYILIPTIILSKVELNRLIYLKFIFHKKFKCIIYNDIDLV